MGFTKVPPLIYEGATPRPEFSTGPATPPRDTAGPADPRGSGQAASRLVRGAIALTGLTLVPALTPEHTHPRRRLVAGPGATVSRVTPPHTRLPRACAL